MEQVAIGNIDGVRVRGHPADAGQGDIGLYYDYALCAFG
jgi:hypothetical protein